MGRRARRVTAPGGATPAVPSLVAVVLTPSPLVHAAWRVAPDSRATPVVVATPGGMLVVVCPRALGSGIAVGQRVAQARLRCPDVRIVRPDPTLATVVWEEMLDALSTVSPTVDAADPTGGLAYLDARGLDALWGDAAGVARQALAVLAARGLQAWAGAGPTRLIARVAAARMGPDGPHAVTEDEARSLVDALPIDTPALGLAPPVVARLRDLGLRTAGAFARLPAASVGLRFGVDAVASWRMVAETREPPLRPWGPPPAHAVTHRDEDGMVDALALEAIVARLAASLAARLGADGTAASALRLLLVCEDGAHHARAADRHPPVQAEGAVTQAARDLLAPLRPSASVVEITLTATGMSIPPTVQHGLWSTAGDERGSARLDAVLAAHARRYGHAGLGRVRRDPYAADGWRWDGLGDGS
jgi:protein ImuB